MKILVERTATPKEIATELEQPLNNVTYHIDTLLGLGCIELVKAEPAGGGRVTKHFYRATRRASFDTEMWEQLGEGEKLDVSTTIVRLSSEDLDEAMARGTFYDPDDNHLSRTPLTVDQHGWDETVEILDRTAEELQAVREAVAARANSADTEPETMPIRVVMLQFRSPPSKSA